MNRSFIIGGYKREREGRAVCIPLRYVFRRPGNLYPGCVRVCLGVVYPMFLDSGSYNMSDELYFSRMTRIYRNFGRKSWTQGVVAV